MSYFTKRYHPPGTTPGLLTNITPEGATLAISLVEYDSHEFTERTQATVEECLAYLATPTITWIHVQGLMGAADLERLGENFGLHPLALEDILNTGQRPKADSFAEQIFAVLSLPFKDNGRVRIEQVSMFLGEKYVISFVNGDFDPFEPIRRRLRGQAGHIRTRGADYLFYALFDRVIDQGFPVLEGFGDEIETLEEELLNEPDHQTLARLHALKRELLLLRRMVWPHRELVNGLLRDEHRLIAADIRPYLRDCHDHSVQIIELLETYRDMSANMLDVYLSATSHRLNEIMRVLTVITTLFIPMTFIVGVYGMNFGNGKSPWAMPELNWYYGYPLVWAVMITSAVGMLVWFKRKKWL
ncbi:Cobalt/magnesium transport protein CorA [Gammaproteobacteria bacterium]